MELGAAYYPEHRDPRRWEFDLDQMAAASVNCLRVGEFAWTRFEPRDGEFDFSWMDDFKNKAARRGIRLLMCPPLRTAPAWLVEQDPGILIEREDGVRLEFGSRYTFCINHPLLQEKGDRLAQVMAAHYGKDPDITGWHLDNEHGDEPDCHCPICRAKFQSWCREQYGSLEDLNKKWGLVFWSLEFNRWEQIPTPRVSKTHHSPGHLQAWRRFRSECTIQSVKMQVDALRLHIAPQQYITTNNQTWNPRTDYFQMDRHLTISGTNYYPDYGDGSWFNPWALACCRGYKGQNFQVHELRNGAHMIPGRAGNTPAPTEAERLVLHCIANGADSIFHFRWRACPFGAEQSHGTLTDYDGRPKRVYAEIQRAFTRLSRLSPQLQDTTLVSQVAVLHDFPTWWMMDTGVMWNGPKGMYLDHAKKVFMALKKQHINVDVIHREADFSAYKLLVAPALSPVDDALAEKLLAFVRSGGTLLWHPLGAIKDLDARIYPDRIHPLLRRELGLDLSEFATLGEAAGTVPADSASFTWNGKTYSARLFCDLPALEGASPLAFYSSGWFAGTPALTETRLGSGRWLYLTTFPDECFYMDFFGDLLVRSGVDTPIQGHLPDDIEVTERRAKDGKRLVFVLNTRAHPQTLNLPPASDLYNDEEVSGAVRLAPYGVRILQL